MSIRTPPAQPTPPARARQEKAREHARREILLAAGGVFARKGFESATLADLAQAAGYAAPSLYRYFASKEEIFRSLLALFKAEMMATFDSPVDRAAPLADRLAALLRTQTELAESRGDVFDVLMREQPDLPGEPSPHAGMRAGLLLYQERMTGWLRQHASRRELRCSIEEAGIVLAGLSHAFHTAQLARPDAVEPDQVARRIIDLALGGLLARPAATT